jgi:flavorubredoxin
MSFINSQSGTRIDEVGDQVFRISTPVPPAAVPGGFSFNQYLLVDDAPLLFHTGMRGMFPLLRQAIEHVMPFDRLRWVAFAHHEPDECGSYREVLEAAPNAAPLCGTIQAMIAIQDLTDRAPRVLPDGESVSLGKKSVTWIDAPHVPHGWDNGFLFESTSRTLLSGDLFTQAGADHPPVTESEILGPSEAMRQAMDYYAHAPTTRSTLERLATLEPMLLASMHGSAYRGDGAALLRALAAAVS